jgi:hypothetical protein
MTTISTSSSPLLQTDIELKEESKDDDDLWRDDVVEARSGDDDVYSAGGDGDTVAIKAVEHAPAPAVTAAEHTHSTAGSGGSITSISSSLFLSLSSNEAAVVNSPPACANEKLTPERCSSPPKIVSLDHSITITTTTTTTSITTTTTTT